jgi:hypothetical protein
MWGSGLIPVCHSAPKNLHFSLVLKQLARTLLHRGVPREL